MLSPAALVPTGELYDNEFCFFILRKAYFKSSRRSGLTEEGIDCAFYHECPASDQVWLYLQPFVGQIDALIPYDTSAVFQQPFLKPLSYQNSTKSYRSSFQLQEYPSPAEIPMPSPLSLIHSLPKQTTLCLTSILQIPPRHSSLQPLNPTLNTRRNPLSPKTETA